MPDIDDYNGYKGTELTILAENIFVTKALRVQFLAIDPTGKNQTGLVTAWENELTLRNSLDEVSRTVLS